MNQPIKVYISFNLHAATSLNIFAVYGIFINLIIVCLIALVNIRLIFFPFSAKKLGENNLHLHMGKFLNRTIGTVPFGTISQEHNERNKKVPENPAFSSTPTIPIFSSFSYLAYRFFFILCSFTKKNA
jgi:hypothetical protein